MNILNVKAIKTVLFLLFLSLVILILSIFGLFLHVDKALSVNSTLSDKVIIIDAGHGGEDGGAEVNGILEKNINLSIAHILSDYLKLSHIKCDMTRKDDRLLYKPGEEKHKKRYDLLNRVEFANNYANAVFISIHQNKFEISKYRGLQVYYSPNNDASSVLAETIQKNAKTLLDNSNRREIKKADFRIKVLDMLKMPAVLVECGFLSNPEEAKLLDSTEYQKKIAFIIYLSAIEYLENNGEL